MTARDIAHMLKPNTTVLGYSLFLAVNAASVWGGVFPFLPLDFQTPQIVFRFFLGQSLVFSLGYLASALGGYYHPGPTRSFLVKLAATPYMLGWCLLIAAIYLEKHAPTLVFFGGCLLGLGACGFYMLWQRLFASQDQDEGNRDLVLGTMYASLLYFSLYLIPQAVTAFLIPLVFLPLFGLAIILKSRKIDRNQPMFEDMPREHPHVYRRVVNDLWRSALCIGALGFCTGIMRSLAIGEPAVGSLVNVMSMGAMLIAALVLLALRQIKNLQLNIVSMYKIFFPFVITAFLLLPFLNAPYSRWLAAVLYALYSVAIMLMMIQCAQASRDRGINPVFIYGIMGGIVYSLHDIGFLGGTFVERINIMGVPPLAAVALAAVYLLGLMYFIGQGGFRKIFSGNDTSDSIELLSAQRNRQAKSAKTRNAPMQNAQEESEQIENAQIESRRTESEQRTSLHAGTKEEHPKHIKPSNLDKPAKKHTTKEAKKATRARKAESSQEAQYRDRLSKQADVLRQHYRLSARETEVMELIARGNSVAHIAESLVVSENTIRTHAKRIYAKLDIHKKQELLDLIESFDPHALDD